MAMVEVKVEGVGLDSNHGPVVVLKEVDGERMLPIWIGHNEAAAIQMKIDGQDYIRPLTHDLIQNMIQSLDARLARVEITELKDRTYYAVLILVNAAGEEIRVDARPSDSVALSLRADAELLVEESLFRDPAIDFEQPVPPQMEDGVEGESKEESAERKRKDLRARLRKIDPGDFGSFKLGG